MNDELDKPKVQAEDNSIAIGEINISGTVSGNISIGHTIIQAADAHLRHDLGILLRNVQTTWIKGVLERSVHAAALLDLGMETREEAVDNPWRMVMETPDQTRETLPRGKKIKDVFYEANGLLLILGEPGSGKTTTLLQLARDLIAEADQAFTQPVPVILNLSTWTNKEQLLNEWLVLELNSKYRLPEKDGEKWLAERRILPLLDGLDEVKLENRVACVEKINQLVKEYGLQGLVVCSCIQDYMALSVRLGFYRAIYIQPLTLQQVDEYLEHAGNKLVSLRATLQADESLKGMAQSPLILNIMSLAYQNTTAEALRDPALNTNEARRRHLFDTYITGMFNRKASTRQYNDEQTKQRLSWLGRNMQRHNEDIFLIERLQPSWLQASYWRWAYILISRLMAWMIIGLSLGMVLALWVVLEGGVIILAGMLGGVLNFAGIALLIGLAVGFMDVLRFDWLNKWIEMIDYLTFWWTVINVVVISGIVVLIFGLLFDLRLSLLFGLIIGLPFGLIFGLRGSRENLENDIQTVEALSWSWEHTLIRALRVGLIVFLISAMLEFCILLTTASNLGQGQDFLIWELIELMAVPSLIAVPISAIFFGLRPEIIETKSIPNQGIRLSIKNSVFGGLIFELIFSTLGLLAGLIQVVELGVGLVSGLIVGLVFGLISALWYGGLDVIQHYVLRLILIILGYTPANYARFLDYAADRIFLQKVGGGYRFIHRLLLEHFANMGETARKV